MSVIMEKRVFFAREAEILYKVKLSRYRHADDKGERRYSSYLFLTSKLDEGEWSALRRPGRALPWGKEPLYPLDRKLGGPQSWSGHRG
jgi:hypothetical protein